MATLGEFLSGGQDRRKRLNKTLGDTLQYYLGPTGIPDRLEALSILNPINDLEQAALNAQRVAGGDTGAIVPMVTDMATVLAPVAGAKLAGQDGTKAIVEALTTFTAPADDAATRFLADEEGALFTAYHASPADFEKFDVTKGGRGASFFAATPERARKGAGAGQNELARLASPQSSGAARMYEVEIDSDNILGMALTPKEREWWDGLPPQMTRDEFDAALGSAPSPEIINNWAFIFDEVATDPRKAAAIASSDYDAIDALGGLVDEDFVYVKGKNPPSLTWEDAQSKGRDVYGRQFPHYAPGSDEAGIAQRTLNRGMGGYLVQDEGGLSVAVANPDLVRILSKTGGEPQGIRAYHGSPRK